jgi:hypothetical protein
MAKMAKIAKIAEIEKPEIRMGCLAYSSARDFQFRQSWQFWQFWQSAGPTEERT